MTDSKSDFETVVLADDWDCVRRTVAAPKTDHFGQTVETHDNAEPVGAGEKAECGECGASRQSIALYAATAESASDNFCEYYVCECGATGEFRSEDNGERVWKGAMTYENTPLN